jgi:glycerol-3-phosphate dehydrogenase (NAD(P)+)
MKKILLIGNGKLGKALSLKLQKSGFEVAVFDKEDIGENINPNLLDFAKLADFVFICAPTSSNEDIINKIKTFSKGSCVFVSFSKGMNLKGETAFEIMEKNLDDFRPWAIVGGPMLSGDIESGSGVVASVGSKQENITDEVVGIFNDCGIDNEKISEAKAVSFFGILKNVYAVGFGVATGLKFDSSKMENLFEQAKKEMILICGKNNFSEDLALRPLGMGDLRATSMADGSSNRNLGLEIINEGKIKSYGESLSVFGFIESKFLIDDETPFIKSIIYVMNKKIPSSFLVQFLKSF